MSQEGRNAGQEQRPVLGRRSANLCGMSTFASRTFLVLCDMHCGHPGGGPDPKLDGSRLGVRLQGPSQAPRVDRERGAHSWRHPQPQHLRGGEERRGRRPEGQGCGAGRGPRRARTPPRGADTPASGEPEGCDPGEGSPLTMPLRELTVRGTELEGKGCGGRARGSARRGFASVLSVAAEAEAGGGPRLLPSPVILCFSNLGLYCKRCLCFLSSLSAYRNFS